MSDFTRVRLGVVCLLVAAAVAAGCGDDDSSSSAAAAVQPPPSLTREGTLSVCADLSFPPMSFEDANQQPTGFDIDTAREVARLWGVELQVQNMPFDGVLPALSSGRCDLAWTGINVTDERLESFDAVPYLETGEVILVPDGNPGSVARPEDLAGLTAATQSGTIYAERLRKLARELERDGREPPTIQTYPKMSDAIQQISVGRADAVVTQDTEAAYRSSQQPETYEVAYRYPDALAFGVYHEQGDHATRRALERALRKLADSGTLRETVEEYGLAPDNLVVR